MRQGIGPRVVLTTAFCALAAIAQPSSAESPIGSSEWTVDSFDDAVDATPGDGLCATEAGACTLRAAVQEANAMAGTDVIHLPAGTYALSLTTPDEDQAASGDLDLLESVAIEGDDAATTIIDGMLGDRIFDVIWDAEKQTAVTLRKLTLTRGRLNAELKSGGAIYSDAHLRLEDVILTDNAAHGLNARGGAIYNEGGRLELVRATLTGNIAGPLLRDQADRSAGGAIFSSGYFAMDASTIESSRAVFGAGVALGDGTAFIYDSDIANNTSDRHGGGMHVGDHGEDGAMLSATLLVSNSRIDGNVVNGQRRPLPDEQTDAPDAPVDAPGARGAGVFITAASVVYVIETSLTGNDAARECYVCNIDGGAIANEEGALIVHRTVFDDNGASRWGGAIYNAEGQTLSIAESIFRGNVVGRNGVVSDPLSGGLGGAIASEGAVTVSHSVITNNRAYRGSALSGSATLENVSIVGNTARGDGAIFVRSADDKITLNHVTLAGNLVGNLSTAGAASIHALPGGEVRVKNSIIAEAGDAANCAGAVTSDGNNVISDASCLAQKLESDLIADPLLGALGDNGGFTATAMPTVDSPARNKIPAADCAFTDQRLLARTSAECDAGAVDSDGADTTFGALQFAATSLDVIEGFGALNIDVARAGGGTAGAVSVDYLITDDSAVAAEGDYTATARRGTLSWAAGENAPKTIIVEINNDDLTEPDEAFVVHLLAPRGGAQLGAVNALNVKILANSNGPATPSAPAASGGGDGGGAAWGILGLAFLSLLARISLSFARQGKGNDE